MLLRLFRSSWQPAYLALLGLCLSCTSAPDIPQEGSSPPVVLLLLVKPGEVPEDSWQGVTKACIAVERERDTGAQVGILEYGSEVRWLLPFQRTKADPAPADPAPGHGEVNLQKALEHAELTIESSPQLHAARKKVILLVGTGDGQADGVESAVRHLSAAGLSISTLCLSGQTFDAVLMSQIATWGEGRFYFTPSVHKIPQLFRNEVEKIVKDNPPKASPAIGESAPASGGPSVRLHLSGSAVAIRNEPFPLRVTIVNDDEPRFCGVPLDDEDWPFEVCDEAGKVTEDLSSQPFRFAKPRIVWLGRRSSWSVDLLVTLRRPGISEIRLRCPASPVGEFLRRSASLPEGASDRDLTSNVLRVEVLSEKGK